MIRRILMSGVVATSIVGCSLFVSLDGLSNGAVPSDASIADGSPITDAATNDATSSNDAAVDAGPYFVMDTCVADSADVVNLTSAGPTDWIHWGLDSDTDVKKITPHVIGPLAQSVNGNQQYPGDPREFSWTDGTTFPTKTSSNGIYDPTGPVSITVDADPTRRLLTLYLGTFTINGRVTAQLTPGSAAVSQPIVGGPDLATQIRCTFHFASPTPAELTVTYAIVDDIDSGGDGPGNLAMIAATVAPDP